MVLYKTGPPGRPLACQIKRWEKTTSGVCSEGTVLSFGVKAHCDVKLAAFIKGTVCLFFSCGQHLKDFKHLIKFMHTTELLF